MPCSSTTTVFFASSILIATIFLTAFVQSAANISVVTWDVYNTHDVNFDQTPQVCVRSLSVFPRNCIKDGAVSGNFFFYCNEDAGSVDLYKCAGDDYYCSQAGCAMTQSFEKGKIGGSIVFGNTFLNWTGIFYDMGKDGYWIQTKYWPRCSGKNCYQNHCGSDPAAYSSVIPAANNVCYRNPDGGGTWSCRFEQPETVLAYKTVWDNPNCNGNAAYGWSGYNASCWGAGSYSDRWWSCFPSRNNFYAIVFDRSGVTAVAANVVISVMTILFFFGFFYV